MRSNVIRTSTDLPDGHWIKNQLPVGTSLRGYAEEKGITEMVIVLRLALSWSGQNRVQLARQLGVTRSQVSQWLNGETNMTLKTYAAILWACGLQISGVRTETVGGVSAVLGERRDEGEKEGA